MGPLMKLNRDPKGRFIWAYSAWRHWIPYLLDCAPRNHALIFEVIALLAKWCDGRRAKCLRLTAEAIDREDERLAKHFGKEAERWRLRGVRLRAMSEEMRQEEAAF